MAEQLCMELFDKDLTAGSLTLTIGYSGIEREFTGGTHKFFFPTNSVNETVNAAVNIYEKYVDRNFLIKKLNLTFNNVEKQVCEQLDFFTDTQSRDKEINRIKTVNRIKKRYGKNAIFKGRDLNPCATALERNKQIGGHKAGES